MNIPGANLLSMALGVIGAQPVKLAKFTGRTTNAAGYHVASYAPPVPIRGSVQPVPRTKYERMGLDFAREYVTLYTVAGVVTVGRDESGDKIIFNGASYLCESGTDWSAQDGWASITAVKVPT